MEAQWQQRLLLPAAAAARQQGQVLLVPRLLLEGSAQVSLQEPYPVLVPAQQCRLLLAAAGGQEAQQVVQQVLGWSPHQRWASCHLQGHQQQWVQECAAHPRL